MGNGCDLPILHHLFHLAHREYTMLLTVNGDICAGVVAVHGLGVIAIVQRLVLRLGCGHIILVHRVHHALGHSLLKCQTVGGIQHLSDKPLLQHGKIVILSPPNWIVDGCISIDVAFLTTGCRSCRRSGG